MRRDSIMCLAMILRMLRHGDEIAGDRRAGAAARGAGATGQRALADGAGAEPCAAGAPTTGCR